MRIALATDATGSDSSAVRHAVAIAAYAGNTLVTIHVEPGDDVADELIERLREAAPDLVVLGTHARHGLAAVFQGSIAEQIVRNLDVPALIIPDEGRGFISDTGQLQIHHILIPARDPSTARVARDAARGLLASLGKTAPIEVTDVPLAAVIARAPEVSLIVMASHGHDGVKDVLLGSPAERVLRDANCPVLCVAV